MDDQWTVRLDADTTGFEQSLRMLEANAERFGSTLTGALKTAAISGRSLEDTLRAIGRSLAGKALDIAFRPLENFANQAISGLLGGLVPFAKGGVPGGIVSAPTLFPMGSGLGLMGEAGSEAIMPLARGADGRLGVRGGGSGPVAVHVTINTPDIDSFRRSEGQVAAMLARSVARGSRNL